MYRCLLMPKCCPNQTKTARCLSDNTFFEFPTLIDNNQHVFVIFSYQNVMFSLFGPHHSTDSNEIALRCSHKTPPPNGADHGEVRCPSPACYPDRVQMMSKRMRVDTMTFKGCSPLPTSLHQHALHQRDQHHQIIH